MSAPKDIVSKGRCEELRKLARAAIKQKGLTDHSYAREIGLNPGTFHQFMLGRRLRRASEVVLAKALGALPEGAEAPLLAPPPPEPKEKRGEGAKEMAEAIDAEARVLEEAVQKKSLMLGDEDKERVRAILREAQGGASLAKLMLRMGTGGTALHGFMRGASGMSPAMANRIMEKLGRPERFVGTVGRALPQAKKKTPEPMLGTPGERLPASEVRAIRRQLETYLKDVHRGSPFSAAAALGVPKGALYRILKGGGLIRKTADALAAKLGPPDGPPPKSRQLALPLSNGDARVARAAPAKISVDEFLGGRMRTPVENSVAAMMARWRREAFELVCRLASEDEGPL